MNNKITRFRVSRQEGHKLLVEGLEKEDGWYLEEDNVRLSIGSYRYEDTVTVNTLQYVNSNFENTWLTHSIVPHKLYSEKELEDAAENQELDQKILNDSSLFSIDNDGLYKVDHIIIPTSEWLERLKESSEVLSEFHDIYYYDWETGKIRHWKANGEDREISIREFYEVEPNNTFHTKVQLDSSAYPFLMDHLLQCFNGVVEDLLKCVRNSSNCPSTDIVGKERDRDLLWMFINAIRYNLSWSRTLEAQRLLEQLNKCNTICSSNKPYKKHNHCGC